MFQPRNLALHQASKALRLLMPDELFVTVRHEVAHLSVFTDGYIIWRVLGMFLPVPTWACYRCADDGVRSPTDNVPNRVQMVTGEPLGESSPVKG